MTKVKCPYCGEMIDKDNQKENINWIKNETAGLGVGRYFHVSCYELAKKTEKREWPEYIKRAATTEGEITMWADMIYDFFIKDLKVKPDYIKIKTQLQSCKKNKMQFEGIYKTVRYVYEIKHLDASKSEGGIGIVPYVYEEAYQYFNSMRDKQNIFITSIEKQIQEKKEVIKLIPHREKGRKKKEIDFSVFNNL